MKELYAMLLHNVITLESKYEIIRVPGGWIYTAWSENGTGGSDQSSCFVPYHNEFQKPPKQSNKGE